MIFYYKLILQYKGTRYFGWQVQPKETGPTIQGELNKALELVSKSTDIKSMGAGRTDSGVHALGQVAKVSIPLEIPSDKLVKALNSHLPEDIRIISAQASSHEFLPTIHAVSKEYHYHFTFNYSASALQRDFIANFPFDLNVSKMQEACKILIGRHDFTNFFCEGTEVSSNVREIYKCEILKIERSDWMLPEHYVLRVVGNGFLKQMVRLLMGAIWNIGRGKVSLEDLKESLGPKKVQKLGPVAPANGLYMVCVNYPD